MINKFYISEGLLIITTIGWIGCLITTRQDKRKISELKAEVDDMRKERIDDWVDTASDILEGQQDSIDRLERKAAELNIHSKAHSCDIDKLTGEIEEIKEILEKTAGVKFTSGEEE